MRARSPANCRIQLLQREEGEAGIPYTCSVYCKNAGLVGAIRKISFCFSSSLPLVIDFIIAFPSISTLFFSMCVCCEEPASLCPLEQVGKKTDKSNDGPSYELLSSLDMFARCIFGRYSARESCVLFCSDIACVANVQKLLNKTKIMIVWEKRVWFLTL